MTKHNTNNIRIRRKYLVWLQDAKGFSDASLDKVAASISEFEAFHRGKDFRSFHPETARAFKRYLSAKRKIRNGAPLSVSTASGFLRDLRDFYKWLNDQAGYKSRLNRSDVEYLSPDKKMEWSRRSSLWKPHPTIEQAQLALTRLPASTLIERRNRALFALLFLTSSRINAAISLRIGHIDINNLCANFDGRDVKTKFGKSFTTAFFPVGDEFMIVFADWLQELKKEHFFCDADPLFPKTKVGVGPTQKFEVLGILHEPWTSTSSARKIFKNAFETAGFPPFSPHRVRDTITRLGEQICKTPEEFKAWSQNMGHDDVMTTFGSYGSVPMGRQIELMRSYSKNNLINHAEK